MKQTIPHIAVAPMLDWTDRHCRYFHRLLSPRARLYTEMITTGALLHGDTERFLRFNEAEHPLILQLGGSEPQDLARCAKMAEDHGYDEVNLNCGCPSDRVQKGRFGACLMKEPDHVATCISAMNDAVDMPVTVKCRIGVDEDDNFEFLHNFIKKVSANGCKIFIIHARKAWLKGLSPKQNREIPELNYERAAKIKESFPDLEIVLNGGLTTLENVRAQLDGFDGVMIGREAYHNPYFLAELEHALCDETLPSRADIARAMIPYAAQEHELHGTPIKSITRHIIGLFHSQPGGRAWRQAVSTLPYQDGADEHVIEEALERQAKAAK